MSDHLEVEETYDVPVSATLPPLDDLPGVAAVAPATEDELVAAYFDTDDLALAALGITLRRRTGGSDAGWHLKLPGAGAGKLEVRLPLGRAVRTVPKPLRELVRGLTRGQPLTPVTTLTTRRRTTRLLDRDDSVLAEVCDDRVSACSEGLVGEPTRSTWREWEVELVADRDDLARATAGRLADAGAEPAAIGSKLLRALGSRVPTPPPEPSDVGPDATARDVVGARLAEQATRILRLDPLVRRDAPDAVHQVRVASRRLRSALATFRPLLARELTDPLRDELQWLGQTLGDARDAEVLRERWGAELADLAGDDHVETFERWVAGDLDAAYEAARDRCLEALDSDRHLALLAALERLRRDPPWACPDAEPEPHEVLLRQVHKDWKRLRNAVAAAEAAADDPRHGELLHEVRKKAKRLRYAAETMLPTHGKDAHRLARAAERVQSSLGTVQDSAVGRRRLAGLVRTAHDEGVPTFAAGVLTAREEEAARMGTAAFDKAWRRLRRKRLRAWLG